MASRGERLLAWLVNTVLVIVTLFIGWVIWWFIVAPRGQNPGKALIGIRVIRTDGSAVRTGGMFVRGLAGWLAGLIPLYLDYLWILWDKDAQTLHDKLVNTVVVKAQGSEKIVESGLGAPPIGAAPPAPYAPPVNLTSSPTPPAACRGIPETPAGSRRRGRRRAPSAAHAGPTSSSRSARCTPGSSSPSAPGRPTRSSGGRSGWERRTPSGTASTTPKC